MGLSNMTWKYDEKTSQNWLSLISSKNDYKWRLDNNWPKSFFVTISISLIIIDLEKYFSSILVTLVNLVYFNSLLRWYFRHLRRSYA